MSTFGVFIETIATVRPHPNADRLELAELEGIGYQFVIGKDTFDPGQRVLYFPLDAVLPGPLIDAMGLTGKLSGKQKNRVKTVKLRGAISQGVVGPLDLIDPSLGEPDEVVVNFDFLDESACLTIEPWEQRKAREQRISDLATQHVDYAPLLGVIKYEPPESNGGSSPSANEYPLPPNVGKYDIENCERWQETVEELMQQPVLITEKLEGSHIAATRYPDGTAMLCSRRCLLGSFTGQEDLDNIQFGTHFYRGARNSQLFESLEKVAALFPGQQITLRGELIGPGVQKNIYGLTALEVRLFDIELDGRAIDAVVFLAICALLPTRAAPLIHEATRTLAEIVGGQDLRSFSNGPSALRAAQLREGIVIKPAYESTHRRLGRLFLKQRSPEYLATAD